MASLKRFEIGITDLGLISSRRRYRIAIRTPLTIVANPHSKLAAGHQIGYYCFYSYDGHLDVEPTDYWKENGGYSPAQTLGYASNVTTWASGGKRVLKHNTWSQETVRLFTSGAQFSRETNYGRDALNRPPVELRGPSRHGWKKLRTEEKGSTAGPPFPIGEFYAMLRATVELRQGQPLADWFTEFSPVLTHLFSGPLWLPNTYEEFAKVRDERIREREEKLKRMAAANDRYKNVAKGVILDTGEDDGSDRQR